MAYKCSSFAARIIWGSLLLSSTLAAECQVPDFLIGPRKEKQRKKKTAVKQFFIHRSKLQAGTSDDDYYTESQVVRGVTRPRPTTACSGQLALRKKARVKREEAGTHIGVCVQIFIRSASLQFGTSDEDF
jgi:hypothetical protein